MFHLLTTFKEKIAAINQTIKDKITSAAIMISHILYKGFVWLKKNYTTRIYNTAL